MCWAAAAAASVAFTEQLVNYGLQIWLTASAATRQKVMDAASTGRMVGRNSLWGDRSNAAICALQPSSNQNQSDTDNKAELKPEFLRKCLWTAPSCCNGWKIKSDHYANSGQYQTNDGGPFVQHRWSFHLALEAPIRGDAITPRSNSWGEEIFPRPRSGGFSVPVCGTSLHA